MHYLDDDKEKEFKEDESDDMNGDTNIDHYLNTSKDDNLLHKKLTNLFNVNYVCY